MPENTYVNKLIVDSETKFDLSSDTITAADLAYGVTAHDRSGAPITGTCTYNADTSDATAAASEILSTKTAYVNGTKLTGSMTNNGSVTGSISTVAGTYTIPAGYHDGGGSVAIDSTEQSKIVAGNIKKDIEILGVTGTYEGSATPTAQAKTATPSSSQQVVTPDIGYDYLTQVTVNPIPYTETENAAGGITITIG